MYELNEKFLLGSTIIWAKNKVGKKGYYPHAIIELEGQITLIGSH